MLNQNTNPQEAESKLRDAMNDEKAQLARSKARRKQIYMAHEQACRANEAREALIRDMRHLAQRLNREADRLAEDPTYPVNSLGVVQAHGPAIDRGCGELNARMEALTAINDIVGDLNA
jgi:hypothetical protein